MKWSITSFYIFILVKEHQEKVKTRHNASLTFRTKNRFIVELFIYIIIFGTWPGIVIDVLIVSQYSSNVNLAFYSFVK